MKYCCKCGKQISDYAAFCPNCGFSQERIVSTDSLKAERIQEAAISKLKGEATRKEKIRNIVKSVSFITGFIAVLIGTFVVISSFNALNCIKGESVLGIGAILYGRAIVEHNMEPVMTGLFIGCTLLLIGCVFFIATFIRKHRKNRHNGLEPN